MDDENDYLNADESEIETDDPVDDPVDEDVPKVETPPPPPTDHVVHVYEHGKYVRTIERPFGAEDAEAFASEYNRTAKPYGRFALTAKESARAKKTVPWPLSAVKLK